MKKFEIYRQEREKGLTYQQIADKYGVSRQVVAQACGRYQRSRYRIWTPSMCIYPNVRNWLNKNQITCGELIRRMGWVPYSTNYVKVRDYLTGETYPQKVTIDKFLEVTGLTYEEFFKTDKDVGETI